jgi:hypothetical protein
MSKKIKENLKAQKDIQIKKIGQVNTKALKNGIKDAKIYEKIATLNTNQIESLLKVSDKAEKLFGEDKFGDFLTKVVDYSED